VWVGGYSNTSIHLFYLNLFFPTKLPWNYSFWEIFQSQKSAHIKGLALGVWSPVVLICLCQPLNTWLVVCQHKYYIVYRWFSKNICYHSSQDCIALTINTQLSCSQNNLLSVLNVSFGNTFIRVQDNWLFTANREGSTTLWFGWCMCVCVGGEGDWSQEALHSCPSLWILDGLATR